jgi:hypothetical protein
MMLLFESAFDCLETMSHYLGTYYLSISFFGAATHAINTPVRIRHSLGTTLYFVNQQSIASPPWQVLAAGPFVFGGASSSTVSLEAFGLRRQPYDISTRSEVVVDAIRLHRCAV